MIVVKINKLNVFLIKIFNQYDFYVGPYVPEDNIPTGRLPEQPISPAGLCDETIRYIYVLIYRKSISFESISFFVGPYEPGDNRPTGQLPERPIPPGKIIVKKKICVMKYCQLFL